MAEAEHDTNAIRSVAILGNDSVAWTSAVILAQALQPYKVSIVLIEPAARKDDSPMVEVSQPALPRLIDIWQFSERELLSACDGLLSLGIQYRSPERQDCFLPFGSHGISPAPASFEQTFFKLYSGAQLTQYNQHFLATQAALAGKFDFPVDDPRSVKSTLRYGVHLDTDKYTEYMQGKARQLGVEIVAAEIAEARCSIDAARIESLALSNGRHIEADFYLDCSGMEGALIERQLGVDYQSWSGWFPWDRLLCCSSAHKGNWSPYSEIRAESFGWSRVAGLQGRTIYQYLYSQASEFDAQVQAASVAADHFHVLPVKPGRRARFWEGNCLALGSAAGSATPLVLSELHWACKALLLWLELYPGRECQNSLRLEYNRHCGQILNGIRDFHLAHGAGDAEYENRLEWPESLAWKHSLFAEQGRLWLNDEEPVPGDSWVALLLGMGVTPQRHDIVLDGIPEETLRAAHEKIITKLVHEANRMPSLKEVVERYCPAPA